MTDTGVRETARTIWWMVLVRGVLAILFGVIVLATPGAALLALVAVYAAYAIVDGVVAIVAGLRHRRAETHWVWHVVQGVVSVAAGVIAVVWPGITVLAILLLVGIWSIVGGVSEIAEAFTMRRAGSTTWGWMLAAGVLSALFGVVLVVQPGAALVTLLWLLGVWAIAFGIVLLVWAFRLRRAVR